MFALPRSIPAHAARLVAAASATGLLGAGLVAFAPAASAATLVATCASTATNTISPAEDPGVGDDNPESVTYSGTGTITCLDVGGKLLAQGTSKFSGTIPAAQCTGDETSGTYKSEVDWSDGTKTTGTYTNFQNIEAEGVGSVKITGTTDTTSTKFPGYAVTILGTDSGSGCNTASGETSKSDITTVTFSSLP